MISGSSIESYITQLCSSTTGWQLKRNPLRASAVHVKGIIICGAVTNKVVGVAKQKNCNVIIAIDPIDFNNISGEALEVLYKQEIFIYAFGPQWEFQQCSNSYFAKLFEVDEALIFRDGASATSFSYDAKQPLHLLLQKFANGSILWSTQQNDEVLLPSIQSVVLAANATAADQYLHTSVNLILSYAIPANLLQVINLSQQSFLYLPRQLLLEKFAQYIYYQFTGKFHDCNVEFQPATIKLPKIIAE